MDFDAWFGEPVSQRAEQKERTRARLLGTALALMRTGGEEAVTIRAVAAVAGVTERTVFRYFGSRDGLLQCVWRRMVELIGPPDLPRTAAALVEKPRNQFPRLHDECELVRAYLHSRARKVVGTSFKNERQQAVIGCVREDLDHLDELSLRRRGAIASLLASPYAWQFLQEFWGFSGTEAGEAAAEALEILLSRRLAY